MTTQIQKTTIVNYGIHKNYLKHWTKEHALREIIQNFIDFGEYKIETTSTILNEDEIVVEISNDYTPTNLDFLAIGLSIKEKSNSIGKYGEGLKMALLVFCRENKYIELNTPTKVIIPDFQETEIGNTLCLHIRNTVQTEKFTIKFQIGKLEWEEFLNNVITPKDVIYDDNYYGRIVSKPVGNIYCGGLFVKNVDNLTKSYDINVAHLNLDRDRMTPSTFNLNWATSKINSSYGKLELKDLTYSDTEYINEIPDNVKVKIKPRLVGNSIEFSYREKGKDILIKNDSAKQILIKDSFFGKIIKRLKMFLAKQLGVYDLLVEFEKKYIHDVEAKIEFEIILDKIK